MIVRPLWIDQAERAAALCRCKLMVYLALPLGRVAGVQCLSSLCLLPWCFPCGARRASTHHLSRGCWSAVLVCATCFAIICASQRRYSTGYLMAKRIEYFDCQVHSATRCSPPLPGAKAGLLFGAQLGSFRDAARPGDHGLPGASADSDVNKCGN